MTAALVWVVAALAAVFLLLLVAIVARRWLADRRGAADGAVRPGVEATLVDYLATEEDRAPPPPRTVAERRVLREVSLATIGELRGRERERLVTLAERSGIIAEAEAELRSRRLLRRRAGAEALRQFHSEASAAALSAALADPDLETSLSCAVALAELDDSAPIAAVLERADEACEERPGAAAAILVALGRRHPEALGEALDSERSTGLRRLAAAIAGELRLAEHAEALRAALEDPDDELVARAARGLGMIGDAAALERLLELAAAEDRAWFVRLAATGALGEIGDERALAPLERELQEGAWPAQAKAARALRSLGGRGEAVLRQALGSPREAVREHARVALED